MRKFLIVLFSSFLVACGTTVPSVKPYKLDIQQGNVVTSKMLLQLRPGMTKSQVRYIMGTPLIQDSFHGNRWDYFYQLREGGKVIEQRRVILDFKGEQLKSVRGDVIPAEGASAANDGVTGTRVVEPEAQAKEKGLWDKLKFWQKDESELAKDAEEAKREAQTKADDAAAKKTEKIEVTPTQQAPVEIEPAKVAPVEEKSTESPVERAEQKSESAEKDEGWLDKLKFWGDDKSDAEAVKNKAVEEKKPVEETEKKGWLDKLKFWKGEEAAKPAESTESEEVKSLTGVPIIELPEANKK
jgi:outer membrane protein assembly factor BamE